MVTKEHKDRKEEMTIEVRKDGEGFLTKVRGRDNLFAFGYSKAEALKELGNVVGMITDYKAGSIKLKS